MTKQVNCFRMFSQVMLAAIGAALVVGVPQAALGSTTAIATGNAPVPIRDLLNGDVSIPNLPPVDGAEFYLPEASRAIHLVLRLGERRVYVYEGDEVKASYPVAIGTAEDPTPVGEFEVFQMIVNPVWRNPWTGEVRQPGANSALGLRWIGFAQQSEGIVGFHGTPTVSSIGQAASHGCVRMYNEDVVELYDQVAIGTRVVVQP